jgi:hypothetical protein
MHYSAQLLLPFVHVVYQLSPLMCPLPLLCSAGNRTHSFVQALLLSYILNPKTCCPNDT